MIYSEIVVQDEAKPPDDIQIILHFVAVEAHDLLCVLQHALNLLSLLHHVSALSSESKPSLIIELKEVSGIAEMTSSDLSNWVTDWLSFYLIVASESR